MTITVNGDKYVATSAKEAKKMSQVNNMIKDHQRGLSLTNISKAYGYKSEFYVKRLFKQFGYLEAHSNTYKANEKLGRKHTGKTSKEDKLWNDLLCRKL